MNFDTMDRRSFLQGTAALGAGLMLGQTATGQSNSDTINIALLGAGAQGKVLMNAILNMKNPNIRFQAVCDIWKDYNLKLVSATLKAYKHKATPYTDYQEMLDKEELDAVIIATPDFWHAEHAIACLNKKLHVYCEKEMSNSLEKAKEMVLASRSNERLLQIGHQRRSNPRYRFCYDNIIKEAKMLGHITTINGQWNRSRQACVDIELNPKLASIAIDEATLNKYGFKSMKQYLNWRWYKGLGGGPIVDLGSHQIDIYAWFLDAQPRSVMASGGTDYWTDHEWYDNVIAIYEFPTKEGIVRASYQTITTNSAGGYFEQFMGDEGTLEISEAAARGNVYREASVPEDNWKPWVAKGFVNQPVKVEKIEAVKGEDSRSSPKPQPYTLPITLDKPFHQPHLENFFDAIHGKAKLNCPGEIGYETAAMVLKVNEAVAKGCKLDFKPDEFHV